MKIKEEVLARGSFEIKYEKQTRFWEEHLGGPKAIQRSVSINLQHSSHASVVSALSSEPLNILFRRALVDKKHQEWLDLIVEITNINLVEGGITSDGIYINTRSLMLDLYTSTR